MKNGNIQYAVCHLQRGSGNDAAMSTHIERKTKEGKDYIPDNADPRRTHLNRELVMFQKGVVDRTQAIQHRIASAGLHRKVGKNQTRDIRVMLTGTHERMTELCKEGRLDEWISANFRWLRQTFGEENVVSCVLHMDEKTPHLHATIVPITEVPRMRRTREGDKKNKVKKGPRLSADDFMTRANLRKYQDSYARAMRGFGLERGIVGSTAKHMANGDYYRKEAMRLDSELAKANAELEKANEGRSTILAMFGKGELAESRKKLKEKDKEIADIKQKTKEIESAKAQLQLNHEREKAQLRNAYQKEIEKAIQKAEESERDSKTKDGEIKRLKGKVDSMQERIDSLDREAHPERYRLSSGAELVNHHIPNPYNPYLHVWTKVGDVEYDNVKDIDYFSEVWERYKKGEATIYELVNDTFEPQEQVNKAQAQLLGATLMLVSGGPGQARVGTGSGGPQSDLPWDDRDKKRKGMKY